MATPAEIEAVLRQDGLDYYGDLEIPLYVPRAGHSVDDAAKVLGLRALSRREERTNTAPVVAVILDEAERHSLRVRAPGGVPMIVREAYRDVRVAVCRAHYSGTLPLPSDAPSLGPVEDARDGDGCAFCEQDRAEVLAAARVLVDLRARQYARSPTDEARRQLRDAEAEVERLEAPHHVPGAVA